MNSRAILAADIFILCITATFCVSDTYGSRQPPPVLQPKTYVSPSGQFKLAVNPSSMHGEGPGTYRLTRGDKVVWSGERHFTLQNAAVSDEGEVVGYSYSAGPEGSSARSLGDFRVVIIDPAGKMRLDESEPRKLTPVFDAPPYPMGRGVILDSDNDRFILRIAEGFGFAEIWRVYRLSDGETLSQFNIKRTMQKHEDRFSYVLDLRLIRGTPLILTQWDMNTQDRGGRFVVFDSKGAVVWTLDLPNDYVGQNPVPTGILRADQPGKFELRLVADKKRVSYEVRPKEGEDGGWTIVETGRSNYDPATRPAASQPATRPAGTQPANAALELKPLGKIVLGNNPRDSGAAHHVICFDLDAEGRIGLTRRDAGGTYSFALMAPDGKVIRELRLEGMSIPKAAWVKGDRWVVAAKPVTAGQTAKLCWLDAATSRIEGHEIKGVKEITGDRQGGFIILTDVREKYTIIHELVGFGPDGKARWAVHENSGDETALFSPEDVTVTTTGQVAVLCKIRNQVQLYDGDGKYIDTVSLAEVMQQKPNYPTAIAADHDGGLIVCDFRGSPEIWRITADRKVLAAFTPQHANGRSFPTTRGVKVGPKGELWACDGASFLRLKKNGIVEQVLGEPPDSDRLGEISALTIDPQGRFYAVSRRTAAVHVFDENGRPLRVMRPLPTDFPSNQAPGKITVAETGDVYVASFNTGYLHFGPDGQRVRFESSGGPVSETWAFQPACRVRWEASAGRIVLVAEDGELNRILDRRPDNTWLEKVDQIAFAPDGTAAVVASSSSEWGQGTTINLYAKTGDPLRTIPVPGGGWVYHLAFDGKRLIVSTGPELLAFTADGKPLGRFTPRAGDAGREKEYWQPFFAPGGNTLLLFRGGTHEIHRFEWRP